MSTLLDTYSHYHLNPDFSILISRTIPEEIGEDKAEVAYETNGIAPINLDPFAYRKAFFKKGSTTNVLSVDVNANVGTNTVVTYQDEVHKGLNKLITYNTLYSKLQEYYDKDTADTCLKLLLTGVIFMNDANSFDQPYCYAFDLTPLLEGLKVSDTQSLRMKPCKYSRTFISQFIQLLAVSSSELLGACAFPNFFVILDWFYRKEYGDDYNFRDSLPHKIIQDFQHIIYSVNWNFRRSQCVDEETEVLTPQGFKKYYELNVGDDIYTWKDGALRVSKTLAVNISEVEENLHVYGSRDLEFCVTDNHRILHKPHGTLRQGLESVWQLSESHEIHGFKQPTPIPIAFESYDKEDYPIDDDTLQFLVCILTEGSIDKREGRQHQLRICKSQRRASLFDIEDLINKIGIPYTKRTKTSSFGGLNTTDKVHLIDYYSFPVEESKKYLELLNYTKRDIPDWFLQLSRRQALLVLKTWSKLDGFIRRKGENSYRLQCDTDTVRDKLQHIAVLAGVGSKVKDKLVNKNNHKATKYLICYNKAVKSMSKKDYQYYKGVVWCPTTEDGVVMFRRNGAVFISGNSSFSNLSILDMGFLKQIFSNYKYPDLSDVNFESVKKLSQNYFEYFDKLYGKDGTPTFPVNTLAVSLDDNRKPLDPDFLDWVARVNCGKSTANVLSTKPTSFSSCCRLRNDINFGENGFQNSFGVGSVSVGSHRVCGLNLPRLPFICDKISFDTIMDSIHKILLTHRRYLKELIDGGFLPLYKNNLMYLNKQYSTIGFVGVPEFLTYNEELKTGLDIQKIFSKITECTQKWQEEDKEFKAIYNVEQIPAEAMASRLATIDTALGYNTHNIELYSNQYVPLTKAVSIDERMQEQAKYEQYTSGGSVLHITMFDNEPLSASLYRRILDRAIELGVTYLGINYAYSVCEHGHVMIGTNYNECPVCTSPIKDVYTRIVGFIVPLRAFSVPRLKEFYQRKSSTCEMIESSLDHAKGKVEV